MASDSDTVHLRNSQRRYLMYLLQPRLYMPLKRQGRVICMRKAHRTCQYDVGNNGVKSRSTPSACTYNILLSDVVATRRTDTLCCAVTFQVDSLQAMILVVSYLVDAVLFLSLKSHSWLRDAPTTLHSVVCRWN